MIIVDSIEERRSVLRQAFACFPTGVTAVCALSEEGPVGMAVSSFTSVSLDPPLLSVCMQNSSSTWPKLRYRPKLGLSVLAEDQAAAGRRLSLKSGDRFAGLDWQVSEDGALFVLGATAWFDCSVHTEVPAGDHTVVLLEVHGLQTKPDVAPLVFHGSRFRRLDDNDLVVEAS
ncbi:flavin reductase family protein [Amycolatopsis thermoflava]|uniref:Flavin reductase (DIM6/NTAB) family NADH-FMN oxidoreductase RutF n=1 Tax=Amycolatopsis thermoflava TaxID=84480 RepID=A0A3N2G6T3_9PSEU|nr:flavin reductase family protein [Amycolatopsis thermoflava]ROS32173.1 flavin reductase (DIM6/NTAB) family NADH-FMN oxidoreductase RutF [Amycolatopsis thermoflava]